MSGKTIGQLIPEYLEFRRTWGHKAANTLAADAAVCRIVLRTIGDIQPANITRRHVDSFVAEIGGKSPATFNQRMSGLRSFLDFCRARKHVPPTFDPVPRLLLPHRKLPDVERRRVPVTRFGQLLDAAANPRDRAFIALGLYLFLRVGEISALRVKDVDLDSGEIAVTVFKSKRHDTMPISAELDEELRRWLIAYQQLVGRPLDPDWYLTPRQWLSPHARDAHGRYVAGAAATSSRIMPTQAINKPETIVKRALLAVGFPTVRGEGGHTLRRSGARAFFDAQVEAGYDGALRKVQAMLHHKHVRMTEHYIGLEEDRYRRDAAVKGQRMFGARDNVVTLTAGLHRASGG